MIGGLLFVGTSACSGPIDRIKALVNMSVAFRPRHPSIKPVEAMRAMMGDGYYVCRFQVILFLQYLTVFGMSDFQQGRVVQNG